MSNYRFIKELIKNAKKVTKNVDKAESLQESAQLTDMYKNLANESIQDNKKLIKNNKDIIEAEKLDPGFSIEYDNFLDEFNRNRYQAGDFSTYARNNQLDINNLLNEIIRQKQREINPKKLRLNDYINRKDPNFYRRPHRARNTSWDRENRPYTTWNNHLNFTEPMDRDVMDLFVTRRGLLNRYFPERPNISDESAAEHTKWLEDHINKELLAKFLEEGF